ncbi:MAG: penicillin-binding protein [Stomatobaculum sp.]|nr:penicillin-binding protein [Stomatobaculum sp.]
MANTTANRQKRRKRRPVLRFFKVLLLLLMVAVLGAGGYTFWRIYPEFEKIRENAVQTYSHMEENDFRMITDTVIYDKDGGKLGVINTGHYQYVAFDDISPWLKKAYIDQEDRRFYSHNGVDVIAMIRAAISYAKNRRVTQGGSTITQQVIKNTYLTQERTIERKITEVLIAPQLEAQFGKDRILEFYCNGNFYAHGCYGVGAASRYYFNKSAADLEPWEAAVLVGISNRPASYEPVGHPANAKKKRNEILNSMYECGDLTEKELKEYCAKPLEINQEHEESNGAQDYMASYAIYCGALQLMKNDNFPFRYTFDTKKEYDEYKSAYNEAYGEKTELIRGGGYKIYTTLDPSIQAKLQQHLDDTLIGYSDEIQESNGKYAMQGAAVAVDNSTGAVVAIVGGRGAGDEYNRGFLSTRQPGSAIKPLLDYGPAFETGYYYPSYVIKDYEFEDGPKNSGGRYRGYLPIREALNRSLNTVAWQLLDRIGIKTGLSYLGKMEFSSISWQDSTAKAVSIGGFTYGARVCDMARGYATLANGGVYNSRTCLRSMILDQTGEELCGEPEKTQVYTEGTAFILTDVLKGTMDAPYGTGRGLDIRGQQAAGKTGTANDSKDTWFCGYTRYYTTAVWVGYDTPRAMPGIYGATIAGDIWRDFMEDIHEGLPELDWEQPASVIKTWYNYDKGNRVEYRSGQRDYFNTAVDPQAKAAYEAVQGTTEYDPRAWREDKAPAPAATPAPVTEAVTEPETVVVPVTGVHGGPGVTHVETIPAPAETLPPETQPPAPETAPPPPAEAPGAAVVVPIGPAP